MKTKIFALIFSFAVILAVGSVKVETANAQTASFPSGCSSALGYSVTTGSPCNGTSTATNGPLPGCATALGYSITNGVPCSGGDVAITFLGGCSSLYGYSTATGAPCNGTAVAFLLTGTTSPGLPTTGDGGNALVNFLALAASGLAAMIGLSYLLRHRSLVS